MSTPETPPSRWICPTCGDPNCGDQDAAPAPAVAPLFTRAEARMIADVLANLPTPLEQRALQCIRVTPQSDADAFREARAIVRLEAELREALPAPAAAPSSLADMLTDAKLNEIAEWVRSVKWWGYQWDRTRESENYQPHDHSGELRARFFALVQPLVDRLTREQAELQQRVNRQTDLLMKANIVECSMLQCSFEVDLKAAEAEIDALRERIAELEAINRQQLPPGTQKWVDAVNAERKALLPAEAAEPTQE